MSSECSPCSRSKIETPSRGRSDARSRERRLITGWPSARRGARARAAGGGVRGRALRLRRAVVAAPRRHLRPPGRFATSSAGDIERFGERARRTGTSVAAIHAFAAFFIAGSAGSVLALERVERGQRLLGARRQLGVGPAARTGAVAGGRRRGRLGLVNVCLDVLGEQRLRSRRLARGAAQKWAASDAAVSPGCTSTSPTRPSPISTVMRSSTDGIVRRDSRQRSSHPEMRAFPLPARAGDRRRRARVRAYRASCSE